MLYAAVKERIVVSQALLSEHLKNQTKQERMLQQCKELYINA